MRLIIRFNVALFFIGLERILRHKSAAVFDNLC